jgi:hypothetical protein
LFTFYHDTLQKREETTTAKFKEDVSIAKNEQERLAHAADRGHAEIAKLDEQVNRLDQERLQQKSEYETLISERDLLGSQLIRRNDELALLYEKSSVLDIVATKGNAELDQLLINLKREDVKKGMLSRTAFKQKQTRNSAEELRKKIYVTQRELLQV